MFVWDSLEQMVIQLLSTTGVRGLNPIYINAIKYYSNSTLSYIYFKFEITNSNWTSLLAW